MTHDRDDFSDGGEPDDLDLPETIVCVDCGGVCHRLTPPFVDGATIGDVVSYRCEDCRDRWDLVVGDPADLDDEY